MTTETHQAWVCDSAGVPLVRREVPLPELADDEVRIRVEHSSICMSDLDVLDGATSATHFPKVAGHEVVGVVLETGASVTLLAIGDRVGVGPLRWSCGTCAFCRDGSENLCPQSQLTANVGLGGGFADSVTICERFAFRLPDALDAADAAPLLCAGLTVFSPLRRHAATPRQVGVLGVGGLGHLAVQFACAMGHEVTAFTNVVTDEERERLAALGASAVVDSTDPQAVKQSRESVDLLLSTVHGDLDMGAWLNSVRRGGTLCLIGNTSRPLGAVALRLIWLQRALAGSAAGSRADAADMLSFAAAHGVAPVVEHAPFPDINGQIERVRRAEPRYRVVLDADVSTKG